MTYIERIKHIDKIINKLPKKKLEEMIQKVEICMEVMKLGFEFVMGFFKEMKLAIDHQNNLQSSSFTPQTPYIGLLN